MEVEQIFDLSTLLQSKQLQYQARLIAMSNTPHIHLLSRAIDD